MNDVGWLKQSLLDAREETRKLPDWVRQVLKAREEHYGPQSWRELRGANVTPAPAPHADERYVETPAPDA